MNQSRRRPTIDEIIYLVQSWKFLKGSLPNVALPNVAIC